MTTIGIIGGTGLYAIEGLTHVREVKVDTPFGPPSDALITGKLGGVDLVFLPRHGRGHVLTPTEVPYRANVYAMKSLGAQWLVSVSSVGSMRENIHPGDMVIVDQYIDRTRLRAETFFGDGVVAHVSMAHPTCPRLRTHLATAARSLGARVHDGGTLLCIEGPSFSTLAESHSYRAMAVDVIGMTAMPEAKLAREAELHYTTVAMVTDYDCWHESHDAVTVDVVLLMLKQNGDLAKSVLANSLPTLNAAPGECRCTTALSAAIQTDRTRLNPQKLQDLGPLVSKYFPQS